MKIKYIDQHIGQATIIGILVAIIALLFIDSIFSFMNELADVGKGNYGVFESLVYVLLTIPGNIYEFFPFAILLGTLLGLGHLAAGHELIVYRSSGVSKIRIIGSVILATFLIQIPVFFMNEFVTPHSEQKAQEFRILSQQKSFALGGDANSLVKKGFWMRNNQNIINVGSILVVEENKDAGVQLIDLSIYRFDEKNRLTKKIDAKKAKNIMNEWILTDVNSLSLMDDRVIKEKIDELKFDNLIDPKLLRVIAVKPDHLSVMSLLSYINYLQRNDLNDRVFKLTFWQRIIFPITSIAMLVAGMPLLFSAGRSVNFGSRIFIGVVIGLVYFAASRLVISSGELLLLHPLISVLISPTLLMIIAFLLLSKHKI